jgi:peptidyl-prolyl cis-trans isomerase D
MIILVFAVEFRPGRGTIARMTKPCAIEYAGECVDQKDYFASYGLVVPRGIESKDVRRLGLRRKVLDGLVERELLVAQARALGLGVGSDAVEAELEAGRAHVSLPAAGSTMLSANLGLCRFRANGSGCESTSDTMVRRLRVRRTEGEPFDYKLYEREIRILANRGPREFKEMQEREMLAARMRNLVRSHVRVSDEEVKFISQRATIRSAVVSRDWFAKYTVDRSDAAVDRWAFENRAQVDSAWESAKASFVAGCPMVREIVFEIPAPTFDDAKDPARKQALDARARLLSGEDFSVVARELSTAPSALLGGALGCLSKSSGLGAEELLKAVEKLEPGKPSEPIETPRGFHIVEVVQRLTDKNAEEVGRRHLALGLYLRFAGDAAAHAFANGLIESVKGGQKLEDAVREATDKALAGLRAPDAKAAKGKPLQSVALAAEDRPKFEVSLPFNRSGNPLPDLEPKEAIAPKAFELAKADALYEKPVETQTGFVVFQLKELAKAEDEAKELAQVRQTLWQMKAEEALSRYIAELRKKAGEKLKVDTSFAEEKTQSDEQ